MVMFDAKEEEKSQRYIVKDLHGDENEEEHWFDPGTEASHLSWVKPGKIAWFRGTRAGKVEERICSMIEFIVTTACPINVSIGY